MVRSAFLLAVVAGALILPGCGEHTPTSPGPIVTPPPTQPPTEPPPAPPVLGVTRILAFGDSMTEGTTSAPLPSFTYRGACDLASANSHPYSCPLQQLLTSRYTSQTITLLNGGLAGEPATGSQTNARFNDALKQGNPEVVLLWEGANDMLALVGQSDTAIDKGISATVNAMEEMVKDATYQKIKVLLATLPPQRVGGTPARGNAALFIAKYNDQLKVMAGKKGAQIIDLYTLVPLSMVGQDGLHLTDAGYQRVAEIYLDALKQFEITSPALR